MAELLKDRYDGAFVERLSKSVGRAARAEGIPFRGAAFRRSVLSRGQDGSFEALELKQRMHRIAASLAPHLFGSYREQLAVLRRAAPEFDGFRGLVFPDFVEQFGLGDWDASLDALEWLTRFSTAELAIRPFLVLDLERGLARMAEWARDPNHHVRRLASEGCRPRLPWASALPALKADPTPLLPILGSLRDDASEYVRRSVANNLNDVSKDHPELVRGLAGEWLRDPDCAEPRRRLVKHACRTLLKAGDPETLLLFGFRDPAGVTVRDLELDRQRLGVGETLEFTLELRSRGPLGRIRLEYAVEYVKANGTTSRKVFQLSEFETDEPRRAVRRRQRFADLTTRRHHPGVHGLAILVNGREKAAARFELVR